MGGGEGAISRGQHDPPHNRHERLPDQVAASRQAHESLPRLRVGRGRATPWRCTPASHAPLSLLRIPILQVRARGSAGLRHCAQSALAATASRQRRHCVLRGGEGEEEGSAAARTLRGLAPAASSSDSVESGTVIGSEGAGLVCEATKEEGEATWLARPAVHASQVRLAARRRGTAARTRRWTKARSWPALRAKARRWSADTTSAASPSRHRRSKRSTLDSRVSTNCRTASPREIRSHAAQEARAHHAEALRQCWVVLRNDAPLQRVARLDQVCYINSETPGDH